MYHVTLITIAGQNPFSQSISFFAVNIPEVHDIQIDLLDLKDVYYKVQTNKLPTSEQRIAQGMVNGIVWTTGQIKNITAFVQRTPEAAKNVEDTIGWYMYEVQIISVSRDVSYHIKWCL